MAMTFSEVQCNQIQSPALNALLLKLHINGNTAHSIIHGPILYGGMSLPHLHTTQGLDQLKFLLGHIRAQDKTCKLILICHRFIQLTLGISSKFLNTSFKRRHKLVPPSWFTSVWKFLSRLGATISITKAWLPPSPNGNDINLMDYFLSQGLSTKHFQSVNQCRIYLQVLLLSDMVSADGKVLMQPVLTGNKLIDHKSTLMWPEQGNPMAADWSVWADSL